MSILNLTTSCGGSWNPLKKRYRESFGATQAQIVDSEMAKLIKSGLVVEKDSRYELTPKGRSLYNLLAKKKGCCQPT
jgi:ribosomal protein S19E (S16A)